MYNNSKDGTVISSFGNKRGTYLKIWESGAYHASERREES